jgi:hypothetical protein
MGRIDAPAEWLDRAVRLLEQAHRNFRERRSVRGKGRRRKACAEHQESGPEWRIHGLHVTPARRGSSVTAIDRSSIAILAVASAAIAGMFWIDPIPQDPAYHGFADTRNVAGVANAWNVLSNLPFLAVGAYGLATLRRLASPRLRTHYVVLCIGVALVALGSAWYHLEPSTHALVWDRLPMTVAFMALFTGVIADRFSWVAGRALLWPSVVAGVASIAWWIRGEMAGAGDLRFYAIVQFLPMILIPLMLLLRPGQWLCAPWLWAGLGAYLGAKIAEYFDAAIYSGLGFMSGHSLKHLLAALASAWVLHAFHAADRYKSPARAL